MMRTYPLRRYRSSLLISLCIGVGGVCGADEAGLRLMSPQAHSGAVSALAIERRAELVATGGSDNRIYLWHLPTARQWRSLVGHSAGIRSLAFSPDSSLLASGDEDGVVRVWHVANGVSLCSWKNTDLSYPQFPYTQAAMRVAWVGNDAVWSVGQRGFARQWRLSDCVETARVALHDHTTWDALRDRDGWTLAAHDAVLRLNAQGKIQWRIPLNTYPLGLISRVSGDAVLLSDGRVLEFNQQGRLVSATGVQFNGGLGMSIAALGDGWVGADGSRVLQLTHTGQVRTVSPLEGLEGESRRLSDLSQVVVAGNTVVAAGTAGLLVLDATTLARKAVIVVPGSGNPNLLAISGDGSRMLLGRGDGSATLWDLQAGRPLETLSTTDPLGSSLASITAAMFTPDGRSLLILRRGRDRRGATDQLLLLSLDSGHFLATVILPDSGFALAFDAPRSRVLVAAKGGVLAFRAADLAPQARIGSLDFVQYLDVSPSGTHVIAANPNGAELIRLVDDQVQTRWSAGEATNEALGGFIQGVRLDRNADTVWFATGHGVSAFDGVGTRRWRTELPEDFHRQLARSPDDRTLIAAGSTAASLDARSGAASALELPAAIESLAYVDARNALMLGADGAVRLWQAGPTPVLEFRTFDEVAVFPCGNEPGTCGQIPAWIAATTDGRFDMDDFASLPKTVWYDKRAPFRPLQLEWFARKAFTPRLLGRALAQQLPAVTPSQAHAISPPVVHIRSVGPLVSDPKALQIKLEVELGSAPLGGVHLYRDGTRVARVPASALRRSGKHYTALVAPVRVRALGRYDPIRIEAVAFDTDGIRSSMARRDHKVVENFAASWLAPRTWLVNIGVNRHENRAFDLSFAANDAQRLGSALSLALARGNAGSVVPLIADSDPAAASKARIREALQVLAGAAPRSMDPQLASLDRARPSDTVIVTFSGHGIVGADGEFYLLPGDTGSGESKNVTPALLAHAVSSRELADWLDGLDADYVTLVFDACHAAAAVDVNGFMPGPMDSAGLGQLAYDKGFAVLVATQADDVALESGRLQHGLLTYALTAEGIDGRAADFSPRDGRIDRIEWLRYGVTRVPDLARRIRRGEMPATLGSRGKFQIGGVEVVPPLAQTPALFYFARGRRDQRLLDLPR